MKDPIPDPVWGLPLTLEQAKEATLEMMRANSELPDAPSDEEIRQVRKAMGLSRGGLPT